MLYSVHTVFYTSFPSEVALQFRDGKANECIMIINGSPFLSQKSDNSLSQGQELSQNLTGPRVSLLINETAVA